MSKNFNEPWVLFAKGNTVAIFDSTRDPNNSVVNWPGFDHKSYTVHRADAKRIVDCINACAGLTYLELQKVPTLHSSLASKDDKIGELSSTIVARGEEIDRFSDDLKAALERMEKLKDEVNHWWYVAKAICPLPYPKKHFTNDIIGKAKKIKDAHD